MRFMPTVGLVLFAAGCAHRVLPPTQTASPHYVTGAAYQLGGTWHYPQEQFGYDATGLAERLPDQTGLTTDGELADPTAMAGAHPTLQLPAIADVTNLDTGRQIRIRLTDRGPANPGRLLGLTRRAADLLGIPEGGAIPVRIELESAASQALRDRLGGGPKGISAAPVAGVSAESLPPPSGRTSSRSVRVAPQRPGDMSGDIPDDSPIGSLERLPDTVRTVPVQPGQLWVRAGQFTQSRYADSQKNKLFGVPVRVQREGGRRQPGYVVMAGPFASVAAADAGLDQVRRAGVTDATIVVE